MAVREFSADPQAPAAARRFLTEALGLMLTPVPYELAGDAELVVSELVTNAVRCGSPIAEVDIRREGDRIVIAVRDEAEGWPEAREATITDVRGRGLPLISALSASWGVRLVASGKLVWAELDIPDS